MLRATLVLAALAVACNQPPPAPAQPAPARTAPAEPAPAPARTDAPTPPPSSPARAPNPLCDPAAAQLAVLHAGDSGVAIAYQDTPLQTWIVAGDAELGRKDDAAIVASLADRSPAGWHLSRGLIASAVAQWMRHHLKRAAEGSEARAAAWSAARCAWELGLRPLAQDPTLAETDPDLAAAVDAAFIAGAEAFAGPAEQLDRVVLPARQTVEKGWYRVAHRHLMRAAREARRLGDPAQAMRALGLLEALRDRMQDKNTPGIAVIEGHLRGDPRSIDPDAIERELAVALVKRARKYCSEAVDPAAGKSLGAPATVAGAVEGLAFTEILLPHMQTALADQRFDRAHHLEAWQTYIRAVQEGDAAEAARVSEELVQVNCSYQRALEIRECTATVDEGKTGI